jgi:hypothetical protein
MPAAFEYVEKGHEIAIRVGMRIDERVSHASLASEVNHIRKTIFPKQRRSHAAVGEVDLLQTECLERREFLEPSLFKARVIIGIEVVDADDDAPILEEPMGHMETDEAGSPGDQDRLEFRHRF